MGRAQIIRTVQISGGIIAAALAALFVWNISAYQTQSTLDARHRAQDSAERAGESIDRACRGADPAAMVECVAKEIEATREDQRAEHDLSAQERMAEWAFWMMVVTAITTGLTAVALWFIKGTLDATRKTVGEAENATKAAQDAVAITREAAEQQLRAYLAIDGFRGDIKNTDGPFQLGLSLRFKNLGQTPALRVFSNFNIMFGPATGTPKDFDFPPGTGGVGFGYMPVGMEHTSGVQWLSGEFTSDLLAKRRVCLFYGFIDYDDVFEHTPRRRTEFCAEIELETGPDGIPVARFATPREHNAIDSDCRRQPDPW